MYTIRHSLSGRAIAREFRNIVQAQICAVELNRNQKWYEIGEWVVTPAYWGKGEI
jgi:RimJ/RimL family protein N-acetyltransferase